jgi:hypothetical protein
MRRSLVIGKIFITRSGYDPQLGKHVKDPYLGDVPTIGACRPDLRKQLSPGDYIFVISGKVVDVPQYVIGGFEVAQKIDARDAYRSLPDQRLRRRSDGQLTGNIIVNGEGRQSTLDDHENFEKRLANYIIGRRPIVLVSDEEIKRGREQTAEALREILRKRGSRPIDLVGRWGTTLNEEQVTLLSKWLRSLKAA